MLHNFVSFLSSGEGDVSLFGELWNYFIENYIDNTVTYENLGLGAITGSSLSAIVFAVMTAVLISVFVSLYDARVLGAFVRKMIDVGALGKENALSLDELGYTYDRNIARSLRKSVRLRKVVYCAEETDHIRELIAQREEYEKRREEAKQLPPFKEVQYEIKSGDHFYIPVEQRAAAEKKFATSAVAWWFIPVAVLLCIVGALAFMLILPFALSLLDSALGALKF